MSWKKNKKQKRTLKIFVDKKVRRPCIFYPLKRKSNHTFSHLHINSHTCTVVSIPAESRITKAVEKSLCIPCCRCGYHEQTHLCLRSNQHNDMRHHDFRERIIKKYIYICIYIGSLQVDFRVEQCSIR